MNKLLSAELKERGLVFQHTGKSLEDITDGAKRTVYLGVDPTADSLHVGNLVLLLLVRRFMEHGHKAILLIGGATGTIGDPSGKNEERNLLSEKIVTENGKKIAKQVEQILGSKVRSVNNNDWLGKEKLIPFLRDIGKHFTVNAMLKKDSVSARIENPDAGISYTEFTYSLLQAYDYLELNDKYGADLQIGGSDQWGNIVSGVDLIRRKSGKEVHALTAPLVVDKKTGKKFGKSENGAVWLDAEKTSPYEMYQFWFNVDDENVGEYLKLYTFIPSAEITALLAEGKKDPGARVPQRKLAEAVTALVHSPKDTLLAQKATEILFSDKPMNEISKTDLEVLRSQARRISKIGIPLIDLLVETGLATSKTEARRFIEEGSVSMNRTKVSDLSRAIMEADFVNGALILKKGKRDQRVVIA